MWMRLYFQGNSVLVERNPEIDLMLTTLINAPMELPTFVNLDGTWVRPASILAWHDEVATNKPRRLAWVEKPD